MGVAVLDDGADLAIDAAAVAVDTVADAAAGAENDRARLSQHSAIGWGIGVTEGKQPVYACSTDAEHERHIVREQAERYALGERFVATAECGQLVYCPRTGPWPEIAWTVCEDCAAVLTTQRTAFSVALGNAV